MSHLFRFFILFELKSIQLKKSIVVKTSFLLSKVKLTVEKGVSPGLTIRGGLEYGLGIYVTGIEANSSAEKAGLKVNLCFFKLLYSRNVRGD